VVLTIILTNTTRKIISRHLPNYTLWFTFPPHSPRFHNAIEHHKSNLFKRFLSFGGAGLAGGSSGGGAGASPSGNSLGGGSGNFLLDVVRVSTPQT